MPVLFVNIGTGDMGSRSQAKCSPCMVVILVCMIGPTGGCKMLDPRFPCEEIIHSFNVFTRFKTLETLDVDNDADVDVVVASSYTDELFVFENMGDGSEWSHHIVSLPGRPHDIALGDFNDDCMTDFAVGGEIFIGWIQNFENHSYIYHHIDALDTRSLIAADFDLDNHTDIVGATEQSVYFYQSLGAGQFAPPSNIDYTASILLDVNTVDANHDELPDLVVSTFYGTDILFQNGSWDSVESEVVHSKVRANEYGIVLAALDESTNDTNLLSNSNGAIFYHRNIHGNGLQWEEVVIDVRNVSERTRGTAAGDLDGDGDQDVIVVTLYGTDLSWYENLDNNGNFSNMKVIHDNFGCWAYAAASADLNGDGWEDIVVACSDFSPRMVWFPNGEFKVSNFHVFVNSLRWLIEQQKPDPIIANKPNFPRINFAYHKLCQNIDNFCHK